jgi:hypothetical protein
MTSFLVLLLSFHREYSDLDIIACSIFALLNLVLNTIVIDSLNKI